MAAQWVRLLVDRLNRPTNLLFLILLLIPNNARAQHPCDEPIQTTIDVRRNDLLRAGFCHVPIDDVGDPIVLGTIQFLIVDGTTVLLDLGYLKPLTVANANGSYYYESAPFSLNTDKNLTVVAVYTGIYSGPSNSVFVDVRGGPRIPTSLLIIKP